MGKLITAGIYWPDGTLKKTGDVWFVYQAMAPLSDHETLIKIGISSAPYSRFTQLYSTCPFEIKLAAYAPVGTRSLAGKIERSILSELSDYGLRGEWLRVQNDDESKRQIAKQVREKIQEKTSRPVKWTCVTGDQIRAFMASRLKEKTLERRK